MEKDVTIYSGSINDLNNYLEITLILTDSTRKKLYYSKKQTVFEYGEQVIKSEDGRIKIFKHIEIISPNGSFKITEIQIQSGLWTIDNVTIDSIEDLITFLSANTSI